MSAKKKAGTGFVNPLIAMTLTVAYTGYASTTKLVHELVLKFPPQVANLSRTQIDQLQVLSAIGSGKCLTAPIGGTIVAVEALIVGGASVQSQLIAESRASAVKDKLVGMGVAKTSIYHGTTLLDEMMVRKSTFSSLTKNEIDSETVIGKR